MKFKKGDIVRYVSSYCNYEGRVRSVSSDIYLNVDFFDTSILRGNPYFLSVDDFELIKSVSPTQKKYK